jgi:hypothetical protein
MYGNPELFIHENSPLSPTQEQLNGLTEAEYYEELHSHHTERVRDIPNEITEINNQIQELETELYALQDAEEQGGQGKKFDKFKSLFKKKKTKSEADELTEFADVVHNTEGLFSGRNAQSLETEKLIMSMLPRQKDNVLEAKEKKYKELEDRLYFLAQRRNRNIWLDDTIRARASKYKRYLNTNRINENRFLWTHYDRSLTYKLEREYDKIVEDVENQRRDVKRTMREIEASKPRDEIYRIGGQGLIEDMKRCCGFRSQRRVVPILNTRVSATTPVSNRRNIYVVRRGRVRTIPTDTSEQRREGVTRAYEAENSLDRN